MTIGNLIISITEVILIVIILIFSLLLKVPIIFTMVILVYLIVLFYSLNNIRKRAALFVFLLAFFVFLLGRDFVLYYSNYGVNLYSEYINNYAHSTLLVTLLTILLSYIVFEKTYINKKKEITNVDNFLVNIAVFRKVTIAVYLIILFFSIVYQLYRVIFTARAGYLGLYSEFSSNVTSGPLRILELIEVGLPIPFTLYLATNPAKKGVIRIFVTYSIYLILTLLTGSRAAFFLGILFMFFYIVTRPDYRKFTTKRFIVFTMASAPFLVLLTMYIQDVRYGNSFELNSTFDLILRFFEQQGVSISTIKLGKMFEQYFPTGKYYLLKFLYSGIIARLFNLPIYHGNNINNALLGNDFNHTLSYFTLGDAYLNGAGTGTSYIAEGMHDGGYLMLVVLSIIYAYLLYTISNHNKFSLWTRGVLLMILPSLLWAPRGNATGFISIIISPSAIFTFIVIFLVYKSLIVIFYRTKKIL